MLVWLMHLFNVSSLSPPIFPDRPFTVATNQQVQITWAGDIFMLLDWWKFL